MSNSITLSKQDIKKLSIATKYVSKDSLRPALCCVCFDFVNGNLSIVATNAHSMYISEAINTGTDLTRQLLLWPEDVKAILKKCAKNSGITFEHMPGKDKELPDVLTFDGFNVQTCVARFPDYHRVVPDNPYSFTCRIEALRAAVNHFIALIPEADLKQLQKRARKNDFYVSSYASESALRITTQYDHILVCMADNEAIRIETTPGQYYNETTLYFNIFLFLKTVSEIYENITFNYSDCQDIIFK